MHVDIFNKQEISKKKKKITSSEPQLIIVRIEAKLIFFFSWG